MAQGGKTSAVGFSGIPFPLSSRHGVVHELCAGISLLSGLWEPWLHRACLFTLHYIDFISSVKNDVYKGRFCSLHESGSLHLEWPERLSVFRAGLAWILESSPWPIGHLVASSRASHVGFVQSYSNLYIAHPPPNPLPRAMTLCEVLYTQMSQVQSWHSQVTDRGGWPRTILGIL